LIGRMYERNRRPPSPSPLAPSPPPSGPQSPAPNPLGGRLWHAPGGAYRRRSPVAPLAFIGRNVDCILPPRLRMTCAPCAASLCCRRGRSFIPWPACARTCRNSTVVPPARRAARTLLLVKISVALDHRALFLRDAHMRQSWCRSRSATSRRE
jgi:hypothetical protein